LLTDNYTYTCGDVQNRCVCNLYPKVMEKRDGGFDRSEKILELRLKGKSMSDRKPEKGVRRT